jgi:quercetin dioxygenase-like cupin family protein
VVVAPSRAVAILPAGRGAGHELDLVEGEGRAWAVVWPGTGAEQRSLHVLELGAGARTRELCHPSEAVYYVTDGAGAVQEEGVEIALVPGSMVHCQPDAPYRFRADDALRLVGGPCPADPALYRPAHREDSTRLARRGAVRVFHRDEASATLPMIAKDARLVVWPGVGAHAANMNYVAMAAGEQNEPHEHPDSEDTLFVLEGRGSIEDLANGVTLTFEAGDVVHVPRGVRHRVRADRGSGITSVGGPCPPDLALLRAAGLLDDPPAA